MKVAEKGDFEWNLAKTRIQFIGGLVNKVRQGYSIARMKRNREAIRTYFTFLDTLYMEIRPYIGDIEDEDEYRQNYEDKIEEIESKISEVEDELEDAEVDEVKVEYQKRLEELNQKKRKLEQLRDLSLQEYLDTQFDNIDRETDSLNKGETAPPMLLRKMRDLDQKVNEIRIELNLDIPRDMEFDPEDAGLEGLRE